MKLFISWSGERSKQLALILREWIPCVIDAVEPWMSDEDIAKGAHWPTYIGMELQEAKFGIICVTPENRDERWVLFEAGALSKAIEKARVCPYLLGLEKTDLRPPLGHFQATTADREDTKKLIVSINETLRGSEEKALSPEILEKKYTAFWPELEARFRAISGVEKVDKKERKDREILEEILELVRGLKRGVEVPFQTRLTLADYLALGEASRPDLQEQAEENRKWLGLVSSRFNSLTAAQKETLLRAMREHRKKKEEEEK